MGEALGAEVQLQDVPLKYPGLRPWEVWLSEAQERMVCAVPPAHKDAFFALCAEHACEATVLGTFTGSGRLVLRDGERVVGDLAMAFLHDGLPRREMQAVWTPPVRPDIDADAALLDALGSPESTLRALLASPNIRSREDVVRTYDHEVQGGTVVKPFVGPSGVGPSDASVVVPLELFRANTLAYAEGRKEPLPGVALSCGIAPRYGLLDPYVMAWAVLDEAVRSAVATGADPDRISVLDNFCWGNPRLPDRLAGLVRAARGCHDAAVAYGTPFISGKDSLNNEYVARDGERRPIPGTLLVSALGVVPDVRATVTTPLKRAGHRLYLLGETRGELGGSAVLGLLDELGTTPPAPFEGALERYRKLHRAIREGWVAAAHDCSDGGLGVALAEMSIGASGPPPGGQTQASVGLGLDVDVAGLGEHGPVAALFCESTGRVVLEVSDEHAEALEQALAGEPLVAIGRVTAEPTLRVRAGQAELLTTTVAAVSAAFRGHVEQDAAHREAARRQQAWGRHQGTRPAGGAR
jgi:phosphoribosylformylglycinamidine synthase